jgi:uncharacterized protein DUF4232
MSLIFQDSDNRPGDNRVTCGVVLRRGRYPAILVADLQNHQWGLSMPGFQSNARRIIAAVVAAGALTLTPAVALANAGSPARPAATEFTPLCQTSSLVVWLDTNGNGAAGTIFYKLHFTNLSGRACTLNGFPFLFAVNLAGRQVGPRAAFRTPPSPRQITVGRGRTVTAVLGIVETGNFTPRVCRPVTAAGLRVFPPNQTRSRLVPFPFSTCSRARGPVSLTIGAVTR